MAKQIYDMYLDKNSVLEVNVTDQSKAYVLQALRAYEANKTPIPVNSFAACQHVRYVSAVGLVCTIYGQCQTDSKIKHW